MHLLLVVGGNPTRVIQTRHLNVLHLSLVNSRDFSCEELLLMVGLGAVILLVRLRGLNLRFGKLRLLVKRLDLRWTTTLVYLDIGIRDHILLS